jgi:hypothetical protein
VLEVKKLANNWLKPTDPRVTPLAEERKRRATRRAAERERYPHSEGVTVHRATGE